MDGLVHSKEVHATVRVAESSDGLSWLSQAVESELVAVILSPDGRRAGVRLSVGEQQRGSEVKQSHSWREEANVAILTWSFIGSGVWATSSPALEAAEAGFGVAALWPIGPGQERGFMEAASTNALLSVRRESGCSGFGVFRHAGRSNVFALVELFSGPEAFQVHSATEHFTEFAAVARPAFAGDQRQTVKGPVKWLS